MTDFLDGVRMGSFDTEYDDDTIEMVLTESAMHLLAHAAAQTESSSAIVSPVAKETEASEPGVQARLGVGALDAAEVSGSAKVPPVAEAPAVVARQQPIAKDQVPPGYRPPMSTLRFALILGLVAVGSALLTAGTYFLTTRAPPPVKVVTIRVPAAPASAVAVAPPAPATTAPSSLLPATAPPSPSPLLAAAAMAAAAASPAPSTDQPATVRFVNPFDKKEVFEFPPGTSQPDARDAVADLLAERARDRGSQLVKTPRRNGKTAADSGAPVVASGVAPRS
jgi:hypothetical protein